MIAAVPMAVARLKDKLPFEFAFPESRHLENHVVARSIVRGSSSIGNAQDSPGKNHGGLVLFSFNLKPKRTCRPSNTMTAKNPRRCPCYQQEKEHGYDTGAIYH